MSQHIQRTLRERETRQTNKHTEKPFSGWIATVSEAAGVPHTNEDANEPKTVTQQSTWAMFLKFKG